MECPICDKGKLHKGKVEEKMYGRKLGTFPALICDSCGESLTDALTTQKIEKIAKRKGLWGLESKVTIRKSGNSLVVSIPKEIADFMKLKQGKKGLIHPDGNRLVIELEA